MINRLFVGLKAVLIVLIGIFTFDVVKIPILSWVDRPDRVQAQSVFPTSAASHKEWNVQNPFYSAQASTVLASRSSTASHWVLKGTLLFGNASKVILENADTGEQVLAGVGESIEGIQIARIDRNFVQLNEGLKKWDLALGENLKESSNKQTRFARIIEPDNLIYKEVRIRKRSLDNLVQKVPNLLNSLELILFEGSPPGPKGYLIAAGKQLMHMDPMGLEDGDVIKKINGVPLDSKETLFEVFKDLPSQRKIEVELNRYDKDMIITYYVDN